MVAAVPLPLPSAPPALLLPYRIRAHAPRNCRAEFGVINQSQSAFNHILNDVSLVVYQFESLAGFSAVVSGDQSSLCRAPPLPCTPAIWANLLQLCGPSCPVAPSCSGAGVCIASAGLRETHQFAAVHDAVNPAVDCWPGLRYCCLLAAGGPPGRVPGGGGEQAAPLQRRQQQRQRRQRLGRWRSCITRHRQRRQQLAACHCHSRRQQQQQWQRQSAAAARHTLGARVRRQRQRCGSCRAAAAGANGPEHHHAWRAAQPCEPPGRAGAGTSLFWGGGSWSAVPGHVAALDVWQQGTHLVGPACAPSLQVCVGESLLIPQRPSETASHPPIPPACAPSPQVRVGESLLIMGPSGAGKTSVLRTLAGLWQSGSGTIRSHGLQGLGDLVGGPSASGVLFLPQRPYMVLGSLRDQLLYPTWASSGSEGGHAGGSGMAAHSSSPKPSDAALAEVLAAVRLGELLERCRPGGRGGNGNGSSGSSSSALDHVADWSSMLSLGEQQRLAFARVLLAGAGAGAGARDRGGCSCCAWDGRAVRRGLACGASLPWFCDPVCCRCCCLQPPSWRCWMRPPALWTPPLRLCCTRWGGGASLPGSGHRVQVAGRARSGDVEQSWQGARGLGMWSSPGRAQGRSGDVEQSWQGAGAGPPVVPGPLLAWPCAPLMYPAPTPSPVPCSPCWRRASRWSAWATAPA